MLANLSMKWRNVIYVEASFITKKIRNFSWSIQKGCKSVKLDFDTFELITVGYVGK